MTSENLEQPSAATSEQRGLWKYWLPRLFGVDTRTLALFRVGLSVMLILDIIFRWIYVKAHYSDIGVLPRGVYISQFTGKYLISIHLSSGLILIQSILFAIALLFAISMLIGHRTTLSTIVSWFLLMSVQNRNYDILDGGDVILRMLLFWAIFLPIGAMFSVDRAWSERPKEDPKIVFSGATVAIMLQFVLLYVYASLLKTGHDWQNGSAVFYALHLDIFATPLAKYLLQFPDVMKFLSHFTLQFELYGPLLMFVPFALARTRVLLVLMFMAMHLGFGLCMELGIFPYIAWCAACLFLPSEFWQWWERKLQPSERPEAVVVLYDMQKPSYQKALKLLRCFFFVRGVTLQAVKGDSLPEGTKGWGVVQGENVLDEEASMNAFLARSTVFGGVLMGVGRFSWRMKWWFFLALASTLRPSMLRARTGLIPGVIAFLLSIYVLIWNLDTGTGMAKGWSDGWRELGWLLRIDQKWGLFAPNPMKEDGWYVIPGKLLNGKVVDLYRKGQPVTWKKPADIAATFGGQRWRKYYLNLWSKEFANRRLYLARYLCREWNRKHYGQELVHEVKIYFMLEYTRHYGPETPQKKVLWTGTCFKKQKKRPVKR